MRIEKGNSILTRGKLLRGLAASAFAIVLLALGPDGLIGGDAGTASWIRAAYGEDLPDLPWKKRRGQKPFKPRPAETLESLLEAYFGPKGLMRLMEVFTPDPKDLNSFDARFAQRHLNFQWRAEQVGRHRRFSPRPCLHPRLPRCEKVTHLMEAAVTNLFAKFYAVAKKANTLCFVVIHGDPTSSVYAEKLGNALDLVHEWLARARLYREATGVDFFVTKIEAEPICGIKVVKIEPDPVVTFLNEQVELKGFVLANDDQEIVGFPIMWILPDGSRPEDNPITFQATQQGLQTIYAVAQYPTGTPSPSYQGIADLSVFPDLRGNWNGYGSETWENCEDPSDNGTYYGQQGYLRIYQQILTPGAPTAEFSGFFSGSDVLESMYGSVTLAGQLEGTSVYSEQETDPSTGEDYVTRGIAHYQGHVEGDLATIDWTFQDTEGDTCEGSGEALFSHIE